MFRRQALDRGAKLVGATKMATGHNADDIAETVLMNSETVRLQCPPQLSRRFATQSFAETFPDSGDA